MGCHIPKRLSRKGLLGTPVLTRLDAAGRSLSVQYLRIQPAMSSCGDQTKHGESYLCHGLTIKQIRFCRLVLLNTPSTCRLPKPYSIPIKKPGSNPLKFPMKYDNHCPSPQPCLHSNKVSYPVPHPVYINNPVPMYVRPWDYRHGNKSYSSCYVGSYWRHKMPAFTTTATALTIKLKNSE